MTAVVFFYEDISGSFSLVLSPVSSRIYVDDKKNNLDIY